MRYNKATVMLGDEDGPDSGVMEVNCPDGYFISGAMIYLEDGKGGFKRSSFRIDPDGTVVRMEDPS